MSEATAKALRDARHKAAQVREKLDLRKRELLEDLAAGLPAKVEQLAKNTAHAQADVTRSLGAEGIAQFRKDLAAESESLAGDIRGAATKMDWPEPPEAYTTVRARDVHSAMFKHLYRRVDKLGLLFKTHGYDVRDDNRERKQGLILPQYLYEEQQFAAVAEALNQLGEAERAVDAAKQLDDRDAVDDLWA